MWSSAASRVIASAASVWHTLITLGELLQSDGVTGRDGVVFSGAGSGSLGLNCQAIYRLTSSGVPSLDWQFGMLPSVHLVLNFHASELLPNRLM